MSVGSNSSAHPNAFADGLIAAGWTPSLVLLMGEVKYRVFVDNTDWETARRVCSLTGGRLAVLKDSATLERLAGVLRSNLANATGLYWAGFYLSQATMHR